MRTAVSQVYHIPQRIDPNDHGDSLTFLVAPSVQKQKFSFLYNEHYSLTEQLTLILVKNASNNLNS